VVQVQVVDLASEPVTPWRTIEPKTNRYDSSSVTHYINSCLFDPIDDGSEEHELFDYYDSGVPIGVHQTRYISVGGWKVDHVLSGYFGPSSTCYPQRVFASAGDTDEPFDPENLNGPVEGPGLEGEFGLGTWVEPRFSLDDYRGRRIRIRFLTTSMKLGTEPYQWSEDGHSSDDGWWIDDVLVSHTLLEPSMVVVDTKDNASLLTDRDNDLVGDGLDCAPDDESAWGIPGEVLDLRLGHSGAAEGTTTLTWGRATTLGAPSVDYVLIVRSDSSCYDLVAGPHATISHSETPSPGELQTFLVQAENVCGRGSLGFGNSGVPRIGCN
jgi:hypothetical protein